MMNKAGYDIGFDVGGSHIAGALFSGIAAASFAAAGALFLLRRKLLKICETA